MLYYYVIIILSLYPPAQQHDIPNRFSIIEYYIDTKTMMHHHTNGFPGGKKQVYMITCKLLSSSVQTYYHCT